MLPFLKKDRAPGIAIEYRKPDSGEEHHSDGLEACMEELHKALSSGDHKAAARIFRDAFSILDAEPHYEGEHINEE